MAEVAPDTLFLADNIPRIVVLERGLAAEDCEAGSRACK